MTTSEWFRHLRVLIVEDNADCALSSAVLLRMNGHIVQITRNGAEALAMLATYSADVALIDLGLPGMDGYEVARQLRIRDGECPLFLVAITGYGQEEDRRRCLDAGFDQHFLKPVDPQLLEDTLRSYQRRLLKGFTDLAHEVPRSCETAAS